MRQVKRLLMTGGAVALLGAALSMPVSAAGSGRITFVQGTPGVKVDICVGSTEIASNLAYGKYKAKVLSVGTRTIRFAKAAPGTCSGTGLYTWVRAVALDSDTTVVLTKFAPKKLVVFPDNYTSMMPLPAGSGMIIWRHASDIGTAGFRYTVDAGTPWYPAADAPYEKGDWGWGWRDDGFRMLWWAHIPPVLNAIAGPIELLTEGDTRHEMVLVGTTLGNTKLVRIDTPY
jgi:hypothetical protein